MSKVGHFSSAKILIHFAQKNDRFHPQKLSLEITDSSVRFRDEEGCRGQIDCCGRIVLVFALVNPFLHITILVIPEGMKNQKHPSYPATNAAHSPQNPNRPSLSNTNSQHDAHGHDPDEYHWIPVPRKRRHDGWTPEKQREFIETLADTGSVVGAARAVGLSKQSAYALRRSKGAEGFAAAWDAAIGQASRLLADVAFDRAINGTEQHVIDREGQHIYTHMRTNDRLLMFLLRAHQPEIYGRGGERTMPVPEQGEPVAEAIDKLLPVQPEDPEKFLADMEDAEDFNENGVSDNVKSGDDTKKEE